MLKAEEPHIPYKVCASYGVCTLSEGEFRKVFADDPSEEGFPFFRQKCLSRNRENGRVEKGEKERYGEEENISDILRKRFEIEKTGSCIETAKLEKEQAEHRSRDP